MKHAAASLTFAIAFFLNSVAVGSPAAVAQVSSNFCGPGQFPTFQFGFAALKARLGDVMGVPVECAHTDPSSGDALQHTSTGLAFYRKLTNTPTFTDGYTHWALTSDRGFVTWTGSSIDPPGTVIPIFRGDARLVGLTLSDFGPGWVMTSENTSKLAIGFYSSDFATVPGYVADYFTDGIAVFSSQTDAIQSWPAVTAVQPNYLPAATTQWGQLNSAETSISDQKSIVTVLERNVIISLFSPGVGEDDLLMRKMVGRIDALSS